MKDVYYFSYSGPQKFIIRTDRIFQFWNSILPCLQANSKHVTVLSMHGHQYVGISSPCPSFMWEYMRGPSGDPTHAVSYILSKLEDPLFL